MAFMLSLQPFWTGPVREGRGGMCGSSPSLAGTSMDTANLVASHLFSSLSCRAMSCVSVPSQCLEWASRRARPREHFSTWRAVGREAQGEAGASVPG